MATLSVLATYLQVGMRNIINNIYISLLNAVISDAFFFFLPQLYKISYFFPLSFFFFFRCLKYKCNILQDLQVSW